MTDEGAKKIKKYSCSKTAEGYNWIVYINEEEGSTLKEEHTFQKFDNIRMVAPYEGQHFEVEVAYGESKCVMMRSDLVAGYSIRQNYTSQVFWDEDNLIKQVQNQGEKKVRYENITQYSMQHNGGIFFYYKNNTQDKTLKEEISFDITGLSIEGEDGTDVKFELGPNQEKVVKLEATGGPWTFGCKCSYGIK